MMATMKLGSKAEAFQLEGQTWRCLTELASDVIIEVGEMSFNLHKFPLLNRSGLLRKMISDFQGEDGKECVIQLHDIPGGAKAFELVAKFCYDIKIELNALNVVSLRCAAEQLRMTEDYVGGNLIMQTESFLNEVFSNWKDSIKALEACESVFPHAEELQIVSRCINSLASKACADPNLFSWPMAGQTTTTTKSPEGNIPWNGIAPVETPRSVIADWWYEDVAFLNLPLFKRLILAMEAKGMKPENIAGALMFYAKRFLPGLSRNLSFRDGTTRIGPGTTISAPSESDQRVFIEEIVDLLPLKKGVTSTKFLLGMLRTSMILRASSSCRENLERRIGAQLDEAALEDILIPNLGYSAETLYDVDCFQRILDHFMLMEQPSVVSSPGIIDERQILTASPLSTPITMVAKLVDGYLAEVAADVNLKPPKFMSLGTLIPDYARPLDDGIYRAIDIYLKSHPWLTESEREQLCRLMNCQKLSLEACTHAAQNERLPLRVIVQVLFFEQLRLRTSIASWFFVSDNVDNSQGSSGHLGQDKSSNIEIQADISREQEDDQHNADDMRSRVIELEKECMSMKQEIEKLGKPKSSWNIFSRKYGFRSKSESNSNSK
ncbi:BTB/POZ domain-containing protein [Canna indica]|uniref:BTB/POZ domain-containing protein n=1 Tax=Canna indica TaxID=4628 RepID=A0AAQ3KVI1_9LILI|nr:BTB/POZ domain-containing protein [Canna indica]